MEEDKEIIIRKAQVTDLENLKEFFIKAYGNKTIFQDSEFLLYYFGSYDEKIEPFSHSIIGVNLEGEIVSHYGGLYSKLKLNEKIITNIWGVNAFTLSEWRGKQINSKIVDFIRKNNEANAVLGMPSNAPYFYEKLGYNIFNRKTLKRFIYAFDRRVFDISVQLGHDIEKSKKLLRINDLEIKVPNRNKVVELTKENFNKYSFDLNVNSVITTHRNINFLNWRLFNNPFISYKIFGFLKSQKVIAYIALREETLLPNNVKVARIIDLFGNIKGIFTLLNHTLKNCLKKGSAYIDFSMFGVLYEKELLSSGFTKLENDEACILPMVTAPIENRPNHEFIVLQSKSNEKKIQNITSKDVYFTRIDGDRDRISMITQLKRNDLKQ